METMTPVKDYEGNVPVVVGTGLTQSTSGNCIRGPSKTNVLALTWVAFAGNRLWTQQVELSSANVRSSQPPVLKPGTKRMLRKIAVE